MKFTTTIQIDLSDADAKVLVEKSGAHLPHDTDIQLALLMAAMTEIYRQGRTFLLAPDRKPLKHSIPASFSTMGSPFIVLVTLEPRTDPPKTTRPRKAPQKPTKRPATKKKPTPKRRNTRQ